MAVRILYAHVPGRVRTTLASLLEQRGHAAEIVPLGEGEAEVLLVGERLTPEEWLLAEQAGVRWVQALTIGLERVLSPKLVESPVALTSLSGLGSADMAEFVFARILEHAKKLRELAELQRTHTWQVMWLESLRGATLTIVGLGPIGAAVAELGRAHRMRLVGVRRRPEAGPGPCDEVVGPHELVRVLGDSDYLVLALPLTAESQGLIGAAELAAMKEGSLLVNVGRGGLVDEAALVAAVDEGRIAAALDVFATEPLPEDSPVWDTPGIAVSPHCSSITPTLFDDISTMVADNVERFLDGQPLHHVVDKRAGYPTARSPAALLDPLSD